MSERSKECSLEFWRKPQPIQKSTTEQTAGDFQALETATEQAARGLASANDRQAMIENRTKLSEKSTTRQMADAASAADAGAVRSAKSQGYALNSRDLVDNVTCINRSSLQKQVLSIRCV